MVACIGYYGRLQRPNETVPQTFNALVSLVEEFSTPPNGGVAALRRFAGTVASLAQEKNLRLAFISVEKKCRTL
jgi:hypothetical protein